MAEAVAEDSSGEEVPGTDVMNDMANQASLLFFTWSMPAKPALTDQFSHDCTHTHSHTHTHTHHWRHSKKRWFHSAALFLAWFLHHFLSISLSLVLLFSVISFFFLYVWFFFCFLSLSFSLVFISIPYTLRASSLYSKIGNELKRNLLSKC